MYYCPNSSATIRQNIERLINRRGPQTGCCTYIVCGSYLFVIVAALTNCRQCLPCARECVKSFTKATVSRIMYTLGENQIFCPYIFLSKSRELRRRRLLFSWIKKLPVSSIRLGFEVLYFV